MPRMHDSSAHAGLSAADVPRLTLKWAFGFPGVSSVYGQPTVAGGRVFVGVDTGYVYALDAATGCVHWSFLAETGVRNAISIGPASLSFGGQPRRRASHAAYFGDIRANVYAVDANTGELLWKVNVDPHPLAVVTGSPTLYEGRLYVPVSSREEAAGGSLNYPCCTFRGSIVALDAATGRQIWKTYAIPDPPKPSRRNSQGHAALDRRRRRHLARSDHRSAPPRHLRRHRRRLHRAGAQEHRRRHGDPHGHGQGALVGAGLRERRLAGGVRAGTQ